MSCNSAFTHSRVRHPRRVLRLQHVRSRHRDDVVARIDEVDLAGDATRERREQVEGRAADVVERRGAPQGRVGGLVVEHQPGIGDAGAGERAHRTG